MLNILRLFGKIKKLTLKDNEIILASEIKNGVTKVQSRPVWLVVPFSEKCNLACEMCGYRINNSYFKIKITEEGYERISTLFQSAKTLCLNGAELFFYNDDDKIVSIFLNKIGKYPNLSVSGLSNGTILSKPKLNLILDNFREIMISIDSPYPDVYESIRIGAKFDKVIANIKEIHNGKLNVGKKIDDSPLITFNYIVMKRTASGIEDFYHLAKSLGAYRIQYSPLRKEAGEALNDFFNSEDVFQDATIATNVYKAISRITSMSVNDGIDIVDRWTSVAIKKLPEMLIDKTESTKQVTCAEPSLKICEHAWKGFFIWQNGDVSFCCGSKKIGNINDKTIEEIWNGDDAIQERRNFLIGNYTNCNPATCPKGLHNFTK